MEFMELKGRQDWFMRDAVRAKVTVKESSEDLQELLHRRCLGYLRTISVHIWFIIIIFQLKEFFPLSSPNQK